MIIAGKKRKSDAKRKTDSLIILLSLIFSISLIFAIIIADYEIIAFNQDYYEMEFSKLGVYSAFESRGISKEELDFKTRETLVFFKGKGELPLDFFLPDEESHMNDVREVMGKIDAFWKASILLIIASIIAIAAIFKRSGIKKAGEVFSKTALVITTALGIIGLLMLSKINFEPLFIGFHRIFFPGGNWTFPIDSTIIMMFPEAFFQRIAARIFFFSGLSLLAAAMLFSLAAKIAEKRDRKKLPEKDRTWRFQVK